MSRISSVVCSTPTAAESDRIDASVDDDAKDDDYEDGEIAHGIEGVADEDEDAADASPLSS